MMDVKRCFVLLSDSRGIFSIKVILHFGVRRSDEIVVVEGSERLEDFKMFREKFLKNVKVDYVKPVSGDLPEVAGWFGEFFVERAYGCGRIIVGLSGPVLTAGLLGLILSWPALSRLGSRVDVAVEAGEGMVMLGGRDLAAVSSVGSLGEADFQVLEEAAGGGTVSNIADALGLEVSSVGRRVWHLASKGFVDVVGGRPRRVSLSRWGGAVVGVWRRVKRLASLDAFLT